MTKEIIVFGRNRQSKEFSHIDYVPGKIFIETKESRGREFEAAISCCRGRDVIFAVLTKADLPRGQGQVRVLKAIADAGAEFREMPAIDAPKKKTAKAVQSGALTEQQESDICAIWSNNLLSEPDRLARINAIEGLPEQSKAQVYYICVTKPKRAAAKANRKDDE